MKQPSGPRHPPSTHAPHPQGQPPTRDDGDEPEADPKSTPEQHRGTDPRRLRWFQHRDAPTPGQTPAPWPKTDAPPHTAPTPDRVSPSDTRPGPTATRRRDESTSTPPRSQPPHTRPHSANAPPQNRRHQGAKTPPPRWKPTSPPRKQKRDAIPPASGESSRSHSVSTDQPSQPRPTGREAADPRSHQEGDIDQRSPNHPPSPNKTLDRPDQTPLDQAPRSRSSPDQPQNQTCLELRAPHRQILSGWPGADQSTVVTSTGRCLIPRMKLERSRSGSPTSKSVTRRRNSSKKTLTSRRANDAPRQT